MMFICLPQLIRTTIFTKHSREPRPDDDLNAENLNVQHDEVEGVAEMELLNGEKKVKTDSSDSFVERLKGTYPQAIFQFKVELIFFWKLGPSRVCSYQSRTSNCC